MRKSVLAALMLVLLCGCAGSGVKIQFTEREYETDTEYISIRIPSFSGIADNNFQDTLNNAYEADIEACLEHFYEESEKGSDSRTEKSRFEVTQEVCCNKNQFLSIVSEIYVYTDGLHGSSDRMAKNIDLKQNRVLQLSDLFLDDGYMTRLTEQVDTILQKNPEKYRDLWEKPVIGEAQQKFFYIKDGNLVLFYPPYELSYYARGFVEFEIPLENLDGYLKPEYAALA